MTSRGATTAEKLRGTKVWVPTPKAGLGVGCGRGSPPPAVRVRGGITPGKFLKTWMLNLAFWRLLAVKFLAFSKLRTRS